MLTNCVVLGDSTSQTLSSPSCKIGLIVSYGAVRGGQGLPVIMFCKKTHLWKFPRGPVIRTLPFHCRGPGFRELESQKLGSEAKKKKEKKRKENQKQKPI